MLSRAIAGRPKATIRQGEGALRAILDAIPDLVWLKSPDGIYLDCNLAVERLFGVSKSDIIGKTDYDFLNKTLADFVREQDRKASATDRPISNEEWLTFTDGGQSRLYETTKTAMREAGGKLVGVLGIARDITERSERERIDDRLTQREVGVKRVLDSAADAILITDQHGRYRYVNEQAVLLLGYDRDEFLRMNIGEITPNEDRAEVELLLQELWSTGSLRCELRLKHKSGTIIPVAFNGAILPDGRAYSSYRDIRARKQAEAEREQQRDTLVREVHHRIKNNLQGVAGLLQRELGKFRELDARLDVAIGQINSIAVVHGLQAVHPDEGMHLSASLRDICRMVSELTQRPVLLPGEDELSTLGQFRVNHHDAISIALVLNELILNSVKHSPPGNSAPSVSMLAEAAGVKLSIRNTVIGTPEFDFDSGDKLGTGLSLVRSLLPRRGASLCYEFDPQGGRMLTSLHLTAPVVLAMEPQEIVRNT
jgi:PAS domain S-box-containing protein